MNKFKNFLLMGAIAITGISTSSCTKDGTEEASKPSIALIKPGSRNISVVQGSTVDVEVLAASNDKKLASFAVQFSQGGGPFSNYGNAFSGNKSDTTLNDANFTYKKNLPTLSGEGVIVYRFITSDKDGNGNTLDLTINVTADTTATISSYSAKLLGDANNSSAGSFFATTNGIVYKQADAKTNATLIDILYFYGSANKATLAAPNDADAGTIYNNASTGLQTWSKKNATTFEATVLTADQFNAINSSTALIAVYGTNPTASKSNNLAQGNVLKFRTEAGKRGFILVKTISENGSSTDAITIDVKVEK